MPEDLQSPLAADVTPEDVSSPGSGMRMILADRQAAQAAAMDGLDANPDDAARSHKVAQVMGLSPAVVYPDREHYEKQLKAGLTSNIIEGNQALRDYVNTHPLGAKISNDDWANLDEISQAAKPLGKQSILSTMVDRFQTGFGKQTSVLLTPTTPKEIEDLQGRPILRHTLQTLAPSVAVLESPFRLVSGLISAGVGGGIRAAEQLTGKDLSDEEEGILGVLSDPGLIATLGPVGTMLEGFASQRAAMRRVLEHTKRGEIPPVGTSELTDALHGEQAKQDQGTFKNLEDKAAAAATGERDIPSLGEFLRLNPEIGESKIGIDAAKIRELYGDTPPKPDDAFLGWVPDLEAKLRFAEMHGGDVEVPMADWLANMRDKGAARKELADFLRLRPEGMTVDEAGRLKPRAEPADAVERAKPVMVELDRLEAEAGHLSEAAQQAVEKFGRESPEASAAFDAVDENRKAHAATNEQLKVIQGTPEPSPTLDTMRRAAGTDEPLAGPRLVGPEVEPKVFNNLLEGVELKGEPIPATPSAKGVQSLHTFKLNDLLSKLNFDDLDPHAKELSKFFGRRLNELVGDTPVHIAAPGDFEKLLAGSPFAAGYQYRDHIVLHNDVANGKLPANLQGHVILHEAAHQVTADAIVKYPELKDRIRKVMDYAHEYLTRTNPELRKQFDYSWKNEKEFIAEGWSNSEFRHAMQGVPVSTDIARELDLGMRTRSVWDAAKVLAKQAFTKMFGKVPPNTVMDAIFRFNEIIDRVNELRQGREGGIEPSPPVEEKGKPFKTPGAVGLKAAEMRRYQEQMAAKQAANAEFSRKLAEKQQQETRTKDWKENLDAVRSEVEDGLKGRPDIAADRLFRLGEIRGEKVRRPKLDLSQVPEDLRKLIPADYYGKGGYSPEDVAKLFGYHTGEEMLHDLARIEKERQLEGLTANAHYTKMVNAETERVMRQRYGDPNGPLEDAKDFVVSDGEMGQIADNLYRFAEENVLDMPFTRKQIIDAAKGEFDRAISGTHSYDKYIAAAGRAMERARDALLEDNPAESFKAQQEHYISMLLAKEARKLEKDKARFSKLVKRDSVRAPAGLPEEYTAWIHDILGRTGHFVRRTVQDWERSIARQAPHDTFEKFVDYKETHHQQPLMAPGFLFDSNWKVKSLDDLSTEDLRDVMRTVKNLDTLGRAEKKFILKGEAIAVEEMKATAKEKFEELAKYLPVKQVKANPSMMDKGTLVAQTLGHGVLQMETSWNQADLGDKFGFFNTHFAYPASAAANRLSALIKEYGAQLKALPALKDLGKSLPPLFNRPSNGLPVDMTRENLIQIMRYMGTESSFDKLVLGWNKDAKKGSLEHTLAQTRLENWVNTHATKEDWDYIVAEGKIYDKMFKEAETMFDSLGITPPAKVPTRTVNTKFGKLDGWYHPLTYDDVELGSSKKLMGNVWDREGFEETSRWRATTAKGWQKERTGYVGPVYLKMDRSASRMQTVLRDVAMRPYVMEASKLFYDKDFQHMVRDNLGQVMMKKLDPFLKDMAGVGRRPNSTLEQVFDQTLEYFRHNIIAELIAGNIHTLQKHTTSAAINSIGEVGVKNWTRDFNSMITMQTGDLHPTLTNRQFAMLSSEELQRRYHNATGTVFGEYDRLTEKKVGVWGNSRDWVYEKGTAPIGYFDLASAVPTWTAEYKKVVEKLLADDPNANPHGRAVELADRAVRRAHGSAAISSRPGAMRGGAMGRMFTSLYGFLNQALQRNYEAMWRSKVMAKNFKEGEFEKGKENLAMAAKLFVTGFIGPAVVEEMVTPYTNSDRDSMASYTWKVAALGASGLVPGAREVAQWLIGGGSDAIGLMSAGIKEGGTFLRDLRHPTTAFDAQHGGKTLSDANALFGALTGRTSNAIGHVIKTGWDVTHATKETPQSIHEFWKDLTSGHPREMRK